MFTPRKRHLRKKRFFLSKQKTFALFNGSNLKAPKIADIRLSLIDAKLYFVPLYLKPPKLGLGYPLIIIIYDHLEALKTNMPQIITKIDCLGLSINKTWYPAKIFESNNTTNLNNKLLALLLKKSNRVRKT